MRKALVLFLAVCLALPGTTVPSAAAPARAEAGLRSYFVITAPQQTAKVAGGVTGNAGTVYATYDMIGVLVVHSANPDLDSAAGRPPAHVLGPARTSA
ncbi:MAG TPA: hypothetical protein VGD15_18415 [Kribbella sp.]